METVIEFTNMTSDEADWSFKKQKYQRITRINTKEKKSPVGGGKTCHLREDELRYNYRNLLDYYLKLKKLLRHNSGIMEISYPYYSAYSLTRSMCDTIAPQSQTLTRLLTRFIDPRDQGFTREEMIGWFDYPEDDLLDVDLDWL